MSLTSYYTTAVPVATGPPPVTAPVPYLRFATAGPEKVTYQKSGSTVTGVTLPDGKHFTGNYNLTTEIDASHGGAEVLVAGLGSFLELDEMLPEEAFGNNSRTIIIYALLPPQDREVAGYGSTNLTSTRTEFDVVSLPNRADQSVDGVGIHMIGNEGTLPNIPWRNEVVRIEIDFDPDAGYAPMGEITISDQYTSEPYHSGPLITGNNPAQRRSFRIGLGGYDGNLGYSGQLRKLHVDLFFPRISASEKAANRAELNPLYNL